MFNSEVQNNNNKFKKNTRYFTKTKKEYQKNIKK